MAGKLIILTGPIGAGKTTLARAIAAIYPTALAVIEGDDFWRFFDRGAHSKGKRKDFALIPTSMLTAALPLCRNGYDVLLDFSIPPETIGKLVRIAGERGTEVHAIALRPSLGICRRRAADRAEGKITDYGDFAEFYATFEEAEIETFTDEEASPEDLAAEIVAGLAKARFRLSHP